MCPFERNGDCLVMDEDEDRSVEKNGYAPLPECPLRGGGELVIVADEVF